MEVHEGHIYSGSSPEYLEPALVVELSDDYFLFLVLIDFLQPTHIFNHVHGRRLRGTAGDSPI